MSLSVAEFVHRWQINALSERSGSQSHFNDLCDMLGEPHPAAADSTGERYTFEKPVSKVYGGKGFADVWLRDHFAWEYKGEKKDLKAAYKQLNDYREDLGNPPLLVVCDLDRFEVHTNFTATRKRVYSFNLKDLLANKLTATCPIPPLEVLRALFGDYNALRPERTDAFVTQEAAKLFAKLAERLEIEKRAHTSSPQATKEQIAHFLMRILFCLFADSIGLLPDRVFRRLIEIDRFYPRRFLLKLPNLFQAMSFPDGFFGEHTIRWFNGGLFEDNAVIQLDKADMGILFDVAHSYDWSHVAPAIFGTLFERSLDPARRSLIGAHYTSEEDILLLIEPVLMRPLEQRWAQVRDSILALLESTDNSVILSAAKNPSISPLPLPVIPQSSHQTPGAPSLAVSPLRVGSTKPGPATKQTSSLLTSNPRAEELLANWFDELTAVRVLDPACGSGNFLYVALRRLLDLWKQARDFAAEHNIQLAMKYAVEKMVSPQQLFGIETEFYAHELASIVVWIGFLQWKHEHGVLEDREPILQKLDNIEHADAILRYSKEDRSPEHPEGIPYEPQWPKADFIIGNPPFLGGKRLRKELGDKYVDDVFRLYQGRVKAEADLVVYWFEKARAYIEQGTLKRAGLLATQSIRQGSNRKALERIKENGDIFFGWSDRPWVLDGADVRISMVGFDGGAEEQRLLNGNTVTQIHADLTSDLNFTVISKLIENAGIAFQGPVKVGKFEIEHSVAMQMLAWPNVNGKSNAEIIKPWFNGGDITDRPSHRWIIDFGLMSESEAALFEAPFEYLKKIVLPKRLKNRDRQRRENWWRLGRSGGNLKEAMQGLSRILVTSRVSKHRFFIWAPQDSIPDTRVVAFARDTDYFCGLLHSTIHVQWFLHTSSRHGVGNDPTYNIESCFDTFPFPWPPGMEPTEDQDPRVEAIAEAARTLVELRDKWLNPPGASESDLKKKTLTNLYNERPTWLANAHRALDEAVFAAYGWPPNLSTQEILSRLLDLNHQRASAQPSPAQ